MVGSINTASLSFIQRRARKQWWFHRFNTADLYFILTLSYHRSTQWCCNEERSLLSLLYLLLHSSALAMVLLSRASSLLRPRRSSLLSYRSFSLLGSLTLKDIPNNEKFLIIDGTCLLYRIFHGQARLKHYPYMKTTTERGGIPCGTAAALASTFTQLCKKVKPSHVAVAFDASRKTFRYDMYPKYKQNRSETPPELSAQFGLCLEVLEYLGARCVKKEEYEADDLMASIAHWSQNQMGYQGQVIFVSTDKDICQMVKADRAYVMQPRTLKVICEKDVYEHFGVTPERLPALMALCGDRADNVPGIKGIGPKIAKELLSRYDTIENLYKEISLIEDIKKSETASNPLSNEAKGKFLDCLSNVRCSPSKILKLLKATSLEEVLMYLSLVNLRKDIDISTLPFGVDGTRGCDSVEYFKYSGEIEDGHSRLKELTDCGQIASCISHLSYLK